MWASLLLKRSSQKQGKRALSTFSKVYCDRHILLNSVSPTTIRIPVSTSNSMDFVIDRDQTVSQFIDTVKAANNQVRSLDLGNEKTILMGDLIRRRFNITVNNSEYIVHPNLSSMLDLK